VQHPDAAGHVRESILPMYMPVRECRSEFVQVRQLRYHARVWDPVSPAEAGAAPPTMFLVHGWMDVSASFQFMVDHLGPQWRVVAPDWRGYGLTGWAGDSYWFPDYMADLDILLDHFSPGQPVKLVGHSMGGNVSMLYAGVRPARVARLVNLEGVGMRQLSGDLAPARYGQWLDELRAGPRLLDYDSRDQVAARLMKNNPRLSAAFADYLSHHWSSQSADGRWQLRGDPAHKLINPDIYRVDEVVACWRQISADVLLVMSEHMGSWHEFTKLPEYAERLKAVASLKRHTVMGAGHMMHHDQPAAVAALIEGFLS
jgi:pimeloyl-ACP methyl ester carboxylesterase